MAADEGRTDVEEGEGLATMGGGESRGEVGDAAVDGAESCKTFMIDGEEGLFF